MIKGVNILKILRLLVILLPMTFMLASCADGDDETPKRNVLESEVDVDELVHKHNDCWQRHIVGQLYNTMGRTAMGMYTQITQGALVVMMLAWAIWFAFTILQHVSSVMEENAAEVWNKVFRKMFICFACGIAASSPAAILFFLNTLVFPIYTAFLEFGSRMLAVANTDPPGEINVGGFIQNWQNQSIGVCKLVGGSKATLSGFPDGPKEMMSCLICALNLRMNLGYGLAFRVLQADGFMAKVVGLLILACFTVVKLGFVFYLVDSIFKFTMMVIILPLLIMGYAFEKTKGFLGTGIKQMIQSAAFMTLIALVMAVAFMAIAEIIVANPGVFGDDDPDTFKEASIAMLCLVLICFLIVSALDVANKLTGAIVGTSADTQFQGKVKMIAGMVAGWATGGLSKLVGKIGFVKSYRAKRDELRFKLNKFAGRAKDDGAE
jgi:hypothetical protein